MAGSKGSLKPKVVVPADELQTALNPASPSGLSGDNTLVTGGPLGAAAEERAVATAAAPLVAQAKDDALTATDKVVAAAQETYTGYIVEAMDRSYSEQFNDFDPSFDGKRHALDLLNQLGVEPTEKHLEVLARAGTEENQLEQAQRMVQHKTNQEILAKHGAYAVASGVLDPAMLITDIATFGASKALSLGRLGAAALGATGATAYTYAADVSGKETQAFEYLLNASLVGGANALFAGGVRPVALPGGLPGTGAAGTATGVRRSVNAFFHLTCHVVTDTHGETVAVLVHRVTVRLKASQLLAEVVGRTHGNPVGVATVQAEGGTRHLDRRTEVSCFSFSKYPLVVGLDATANLGSVHWGTTCNHTIGADLDVLQYAGRAVVLERRLVARRIGWVHLREHATDQLLIVALEDRL